MKIFKTPDPARCPCCNRLPRLRIVGDYKHLFICDCDHYLSPLNSGDARSSVRQAIKIWNKRCKKRSNSLIEAST